MGARRVLVLRHGRTAWNAQRRFQGHADPPLDEVGVAQAWAVAPVIAAMRPDLLVTSDARRARQTAAVIAETTGLEAVVEPRFHERGLGHWEGLTRDEVAARYPDEYADWAAGGEVHRRGGETRAQVRERALAAFRELPDVPVTVIVSHGATSTTMLCTLLGMPDDLRPLGSLVNCHWAELERNVDAAGWRLRGHNLGVPGAVVPLPERASESDGDGGEDADA